MERSIEMQLARKQNNFYYHALCAIDTAMEIVKQFDGKQANKRLETAMQKVDKHLHCHKDIYLDGWEIEYCDYDDRHIIYGTGLNCCAYYIKDYQYRIAADHDGNWITEDGKWNAENILKALEKGKEQLADMFNVYDKALSEIEVYEHRHAELKKQLDDWKRNTPWIIKSYFNLSL